MEQKPMVELLAPAGDKDSFYGAIHAGADAIYLGGSRFSARAYADNFSMEELLGCIRYAHLWGRKVYLAVNTLIKEGEFAEVYNSVKPCYEAGLDGVIVQDIGLLALFRRHFPDMELHASTQMTLTGVPGAALLKRLGACRIVPARELSLEEICDIKKQTGLSVETFIHGAMCYCYSGQCLFSSMLGGRSGNRGRCAQPCRLPYKIETDTGRTKDCFPLSLKDMCTLEHIPKLIEAGIDSFKIEGRMKKPEYVAGVTAIYRKYIDLYYQAREEKDLDWGRDLAEDIEKLKNLYIRSEIQDGYYFKHNGREMITIDSPAYSGSDEKLLSEIRDRYLAKSLDMPIFVKGTFLTGMQAQVTVSLEKDCEAPLTATAVGDVVQTAQKQPVTLQNIEKQLGRLGDSIFRAVQIEVKVDKDAFYALGAMNELRREAVRKLEDLLIARNGLTVRREAREADLQLFSKQEQRKNSKEGSKEEGCRCASSHGFVLSLNTIEQLTAVTKWMGKNASVSRIYLNGDMLLTDTNETMRLCRLLKECTKRQERNKKEQVTGEQTKKEQVTNESPQKEAITKEPGINEPIELIISLPRIIRKRDDAYLEQLLMLLGQNRGIFGGVQVKNLDGMGLWKKFSGKIYGDAGLYVWNQGTFETWKPFLEGICLPLELTGREQRELLTQNPPVFEKIVYGRTPMMVTAGCVAKTAGQCRMGEIKRAGLIDRYRKTFPVEINCLHCMNIIYNSVPLSLHGELEKWKGKVLFRLDFTLESGEETLGILDFYESMRQVKFKKSAKEPPFSEYTTGHERHGTE